MQYARLLGALALLAFVGCDAASVSPAPTLAPTQANGVIHRATAGGGDICEATGRPTGCNANYSLVATMKADGSVRGQAQDVFEPGSGEGYHSSIDCLQVVGNVAIMSGTITRGSTAGVDVSGQYLITAVEDNGTSSQDPPDRISYSYRSLTPFDCQAYPPEAFAWFPLAHGQVTVR